MENQIRVSDQYCPEKITELLFFFFLLFPLSRKCYINTFCRQANEKYTQGVVTEITNTWMMDEERKTLSLSCIDFSSNIASFQYFRWLFCSALGQD